MHSLLQWIALDVHSLIDRSAGWDFDNREGLGKQAKSYIKDAMIYCKISISN